MPNTVGPWGSSSSGVNTIPGTPTPLATVTSATWGGIGGSITSQADLQTALAAKASLSGATFTGTVQSTGGLWSVTAAGVANFTSIASGVNWGGITGPSPQASPSGGWSTAASFGSNAVSMGALTAAQATFSGNITRFQGGGTPSILLKYEPGAIYGSSLYLGTDLGSTQGAVNLITGYGLSGGTNGYPNFAIRMSTTGQAWGGDLSILSYTNAFTINGNTLAATFASSVAVGGTLSIPVGNYLCNASTTVFFGDSSVLISGYGNTWAAVRGSSGVVLGTGATWGAVIQGGPTGLADFSGNGRFGGTTLTVLGYSANAANLVLNAPGQYIGVGNLSANECKIANCNSLGAWDAANPSMDLYLGYANNLVLHMGNIGTNAATLQAAVASANAPKMGTYAQMIAWTVATGTTPYWYATDVTETDGLLGKLYQWNGSSWVAVGGAQTVTGRVVAGVISAGAVGAQALAADVALIGQVLRSTGFTAGTTTAAPTGFKMSGTAFTSYCYNGDTTGIYSTSLSSYMEIGSGCSLGGYALGSLVLGRLINAGMKVYSPGTYTWVCPPGITQVVVTLSGGGGSGCHDASNPGGGGGAGCLTVISSVTPGTSYTVVCGAGGAGTSTTSGNAGGNSTFNGLTAQGGAAGYTGGGGYGGGAGPLGQMTSGNGTMASMATGAVYIMCGQGARGGGGGTDPGSTQWQTGTGFGVGGGSSAAGPGYGSGSDGKTSGSTTAGGQGVVILSW